MIETLLAALPGPLIPVHTVFDPMILLRLPIASKAILVSLAMIFCGRLLLKLGRGGRKS
jgi:hypothetical protein